VLNPKIPNVGVGERLAAGLAAIWHSLSVKGIGIESVLSGLLFVGLQREGVWVEGKETMRCDTCGWDGNIL